MKYSLFGFLFVMAGIIPSAAFADGGFFPSVIFSAPEISEPNQTAAILFDEKNSQEKLVIGATAGGDVPDYAWVIPTPSYPTVTEGDPKLFSDLWDLTKPEYVNNKVSFPLFFSGMTLGLSGGVVSVYDQYTVGVFDVAVLSATGSSSLLEWLHANGYGISEKAQGVLDSYIEKKWYFVALKVNQLNIPIIKELHKIDQRIVSPQTAESILTERVMNTVTGAESFSNNNPILSFMYVPTEKERQGRYLPRDPYKIVEADFIRKMQGNYQLALQDRAAYIIQNLYEHDWHGSCQIIKARYCHNISGFEYILSQDSFSGTQNEISQYFGVSDSEQVRGVFINRLAQDITSNVPYERSFVSALVKNGLVVTRGDAKANYELLQNKYSSEGDILTQVRSEVERRLREYASGNTYSSFGMNASRGAIPSPVEMTFTSNVPIFPLRISSVNSGQSNITLYVISSRYLAASGFEAKFRGEITNPRDSVAAFLDGSPNTKLTRLFATIQAKDMTDDIVFVPSVSQRVYREKVYAEPERFSLKHISLIALSYAFPFMIWLLIAIMTEPMIRIRTRHYPWIAPYTFRAKVIYAVLLALPPLSSLAYFLLSVLLMLGYYSWRLFPLLGLIVFISILPIFIGIVLLLHEFVSWIRKKHFFSKNKEAQEQASNDSNIPSV